MKNLYPVISLVFLVSFIGFCQDSTPNYDEAAVPSYTLPAPLVFEDGRTLSIAGEWPQRKAEIFALFERDVYGTSPAWQGDMEAVELFRSAEALEGLALLREIRLRLTWQGRTADIHVLMHLPKSDSPVPVFLGLNFFGNHTTTFNENVWLNSNWMPASEALGIIDNRATETSRGLRVSRWPAKEIVERGYGLLTIYCGDIDPDYEHGFTQGVHALMDMDRDSTSWGTVAAWAWGLSRVMDYLETDPLIDHEQVAVIGHSRLGKAALWAGAMDERFAMVVSNNSGCGGAALSKRQFGETVYAINRQFPHWFNDRFKLFNNKEVDLPVDQHQLIALIAPRPVYVASAEDDLWADPQGEFLAAKAASTVYSFLGIDGLPVNTMPEVNDPVMGGIGYHVRSGGHDITLYDWFRYLDFADKHFGTNN